MDDTAERICLPRLPAFKESTFCVDQADTDTVEYIRADLHQQALDRIEALEAEVGRVKVLEDVLREIANGAINDNGGVTLDHGHMIRAFFKARAALAKAKGDE